MVAGQSRNPPTNRGPSRGGRFGARAGGPADGERRPRTGPRPGQAGPPGNAARSPESLAADVEVVHNDDHILVVNKPGGLATTSTESEGPDLVSLLRAELPKRAPLWVIHRLDQPVSGLLVLARSELAAHQLKDALRRGTLRRLYVAGVQGAWEHPDQRWRHALVEPDEGPTAPVLPGVRSATARGAETTVAAIRSGTDRSRVLVRIDTGRRHQIRSVLQALGHPVVGDTLYGASPPRRSEIALHAWRLAFVHPATGRPLSFTADKGALTDGAAGAVGALEAAALLPAPSADAPPRFGQVLASLRAGWTDDAFVESADLVDRLRASIAAFLLRGEALHRVHDASGFLDTGWRPGDASPALWLSVLLPAALGDLGTRADVELLLRQRPATLGLVLPHPAFVTAYDADGIETQGFGAYLADGPRPADGQVTLHHLPLERWMGRLAALGYRIDAIEEWPSATLVPRAAEGERARFSRQCPQFLAIRAVHHGG